MIFLKREFRESVSNLVFVSEKIDPLGVGSSSLFFRPWPQGGWRIFFASGEERTEFAFFSQKIVKRNKKKEARETVMQRERRRREEESSLLMCLSLFSFEEFRYTNNK